MKIKIGSRRSNLALKQANFVSEKINSSKEKINTEIIKIKTSGDKGQKKGVGLFVQEINNAIQKGKIDIGVHSLKDIPSEIPEDLSLTSFPKRDDPKDVLCCPEGHNLKNLPQNSIIGTGSTRRKLELKHLRNDLSVEPIRGNIETRLDKVKNGKYDGLITSKAALIRLDLEHEITYTFDFHEMIPAAGQATIGIIKKSSSELEVLEEINDEKVMKESICERAFMEEIGLGCRAGTGALAEIQKDGSIQLLSVLHEDEERKIVKNRGENPKKVGKEAAMRLKNER